MKKIILIILSLVVLSSCTVQKQLYTWNDYHVKSYNYLKNGDDKAIQELINTYIKIIEKQKKGRNTVPPGIYADYGFILLQMGKTVEGKAMLEKEIELYPESKEFILRILKMMEV